MSNVSVILPVYNYKDPILEVLKKIKHQNNSEYILRPDFINFFRMYK